VIACQGTPIAVPVLLTTWGLLCWFVGVRQFVRDPRAMLRKIAEQRSRSRLLHPFGGGDVEQEFQRQWRLRWIVPVVIVGYVLGTAWAWVDVGRCAL
jgi:hypothetical protein